MSGRGTRFQEGFWIGTCQFSKERAGVVRFAENRTQGKSLDLACEVAAQRDGTPRIFTDTTRMRRDDDPGFVRLRVTDSAVSHNLIHPLVIEDDP